MKIALYYLATPNVGGWVTYTAHLQRQLERHGHEVYLFKVGERTETFVRNWNCGLVYQNVDIYDACDYEFDARIVVSQDERSADKAEELIESTGAWLICHDTMEVRKDKDLFASASGRIITIRARLTEVLDELGIESIHLRHPYERFHGGPMMELDLRFTEINSSDRPKCQRWPKSSPSFAVAISRVDFDKNTKIIVEANEQGANVDIFGWVNRAYVYHTIGAERFYPWYYGKFVQHGAGYQIARDSTAVVDLTRIPEDGGGTQYTFLEAWDAERPLFIWHEWLDHPGPMIENHNCIAVHSADDLVEKLRSLDDVEYNKLVRNGIECLSMHDVSERYLELMIK